jgi:hypothetical protein
VKYRNISSDVYVLASDQIAIIAMLILSVHTYRFWTAIRRRNTAMLSLMNIMFATYAIVARV